MKVRPPAIYITGATASGKSNLAYRLAELLGGEIVSVDSMQVYRGLDIGTDKLSSALRRKIPHHLIDILNPEESFDAQKFIDYAEAALKEITERGKIPIFCGGTGMYYKAWFEGLEEEIPKDPVLKETLQSLPLEELVEQLRKKSPDSIGKIDLQNRRRVERALEIIYSTGKTYTEYRSHWQKTDFPHVFLLILNRERAGLVERINRRIDKMFESGLVEETQHLLRQGLEKNTTAMQAIGYRQVVEHLRGEHSLAETIELVKIKTRQFAKRQNTWFRGQLPYGEWVEMDNREEKEVLEQVISRWKQFQKS